MRAFYQEGSHLEVVTVKDYRRRPFFCHIKMQMVFSLLY